MDVGQLRMAANEQHIHKRRASPDMLLKPLGCLAPVKTHNWFIAATNKIHARLQIQLPGWSTTVPEDMLSGTGLAIVICYFSIHPPYL